MLNRESGSCDLVKRGSVFKLIRLWKQPSCNPRRLRHVGSRHEKAVLRLQYKLVRELGRGAMGVVFEGADPVIGRTVAMKVIRYRPLATAGENAELHLRFIRECSAAGRLSHPNIVTIYHRGEHEGMQYLVMEYVPGASLEASWRPLSQAIVAARPTRPG
jgi:serine/threonine protein kinase